ALPIYSETAAKLPERFFTEEHRERCILRRRGVRQRGHHGNRLVANRLSRCTQCVECGEHPREVAGIDLGLCLDEPGINAGEYRERIRLAIKQLTNPRRAAVE